MAKGYLLVFLTAIISGFSIFINKFGVGIFKNPYLYTFLRNVTVAIFLTFLLILFKDWKNFAKLTKKQWLLLLIVGLVGGCIPFFLFFKGLSMTSSAEAGFIHKTLFLWASILALLFLKEKLDKKFFIGASTLLFGNFILLKDFLLRGNYGNFLVLVATLFWAIENTIAKYLLKDLTGRQVAWGRMFFGSLFMLIYLAFTNQLTPILALSSKQINWVLITSAFLFGYVFTWYSGLKYIPLSQATIILLLGSPITTFLNFIHNSILHRSFVPPPQNEILSSLLVVLGIFVVLGLKKILEIFSALKKLIYVRT